MSSFIIKYNHIFYSFKYFVVNPKGIHPNTKSSLLTVQYIRLTARYQPLLWKGGHVTQSGVILPQFTSTCRRVLFTTFPFVSFHEPLFGALIDAGSTSVTTMHFVQGNASFAKCTFYRSELWTMIFFRLFPSSLSAEERRWLAVPEASVVFLSSKTQWNPFNRVTGCPVSTLQKVPNSKSCDCEQQ